MRGSGGGEGRGGEGRGGKEERNNGRMIDKGGGKSEGGNVFLMVVK